jgi:hypothetical protein
MDAVYVRALNVIKTYIRYNIIYTPHSNDMIELLLLLHNFFKKIQDSVWLKILTQNLKFLLIA